MARTKSSSRWLQEHVNDPYVKQAQKDGYRSRSSYKLLELNEKDRLIRPGMLIVDLGAAPGGWSWVLLEKRARVIAVDPAMLRPDLYERRGLRHVKESAFTFEPEETVDWLFCDMAWRPLEAAALLAKWARRHWARMLVANLKLPMKRKAEMAIRLREVLADGGWTRIRMRQLYHDRDEITVVAARG